MVTSATRGNASIKGRPIAARVAPFGSSAFLWSIGACISSLLTASSPARADTIEECASASEQGQVLRDRGELRAARALLVKCAAEACPGVVRKDCAEWLDGVDRKMPTITPRARDEAGRDQIDVRLTADGELLATSLDGRAIPIDPGPRRLRFERPGSPPVEEQIIVREGEKNRPIDVVFGPAKSASPAKPEPPSAPPDSGGGFRIPTASWILGGVAVAGAASFTFFGLRAKGDVDEMRISCAPVCDAARVDAAKRDALIANISLGAGAAALVTAGVLVFVSQPASASSSASATSSFPIALRASLGPSGVTLGGVF
jgi:hypothetical protein